MTRYDDEDDERFWRDLLIAMNHPDFADLSTVDALGELYDRRRDDWRGRVRDDLRTTDLP